MRVNFHNLVCISALIVCAGCSSGPVLRDSGLAALQRGDYETAVIKLKKACLKMPYSATVFCNLGLAYWHSGRLNDALEALESAASLKPDDPRPLEFTGWVYAEKNEWGKAKESFILAEERAPNTPRILTAKAVAETHVGEIKYAVAYLTEALQYDNDYPPALYNIGVLLRDHTVNIDKAGAYFKKYLEVADDDEHAEVARKFLDSLDQSIVESEENELESGLLAARDEIKNEEYVKALIMLKELAEKIPDNADVMWETATLYDKHLEYTEKAKEAYASFKKLFPDDPRNKPEVQPKNEVVSTEVVAEKAPEGAEKKTEPEPVKPESVDKPAKVPVVADIPKPEITTSVIRLSSDAFSKGLDLYNARDYDGAIKQYEKALEHNPKFTNASFNLGLSYKAKGELERARHSFEYTINLDPGIVKAHYMLAVLYYNDLKDINKAMRHVVAALEVKPDYAKAHYLLGLLWQSKSKDRPDLAKDHFESCIKLVPKNDPLAKSARERLSKLKL